MAININDNNVQQFQRAAGNSLAKANGKEKSTDAVNTVNTTPAPSSTKKSTDSLTLTDSAINLKKLEESIAHLPIVDMKKVEEIQNKINDGSYTINPDKIAQRFIEMEIALSK